MGKSSSLLYFDHSVDMGGLYLLWIIVIFNGRRNLIHVHGLDGKALNWINEEKPNSLLFIPKFHRLCPCLQSGIARETPWVLTSLLWFNLQIYFWVIGSNFLLRCSWTYKLSAHLRHNYLTLFAVTGLEMFRRFQWVFFRVENEWNKMTRSGIQLSETPREDDKLLGSDNHQV